MKRYLSCIERLFSLTHFTPRGTPTVFQNPIVSSSLGAITHNQHQVIHLVIMKMKVEIAVLRKEHT